MAAAKAAGAKIIVMHVGGEARRGELTDPSFKSMAPEADYIIVATEAEVLRKPELSWQGQP